MHNGHELQTVYTMSDGKSVTQLETITVVKDLGVYITSDLKPTEQCIQAAKKAQSVLGMIYRQFKTIDKEDFGILYKSYVRPHLEYCIQAWSPKLQKDKVLLKKVQRRATRMVKGFKKLPYETRLKKLGIHSLERRRLRGDLIEKNLQDADWKRTCQLQQVLRTGRYHQRTQRTLTETIQAEMSQNNQTKLLQLTDC